MNRIFYLVASFLFLLSSPMLGFSQQTQEGDYRLLLKSGNVLHHSNLTEFVSDFGKSTYALYEGNYYVVVQFNQTPTQQQRAAIENSGIELLNYLPKYAYYARIPEHYDANQLAAFNIRGIFELDAINKIHPNITSGDYPDYAIAGNNELDLSITSFSSISDDKVREAIVEAGFKLITVEMQENFITVRANINGYSSIGIFTLCSIY